MFITRYVGRFFFFNDPGFYASNMGTTCKVRDMFLFVNIEIIRLYAWWPGDAQTNRLKHCFLEGLCERDLGHCDRMYKSRVPLFSFTKRHFTAHKS